ncbi:MAG: response regulator [Pseudolabrys sp.]|nr:response regulator [Pseudolabrys sp.]MCW5686084.1 response regulator [Pseudolabrys sp.]
MSADGQSSPLSGLHCLIVEDEFLIAVDYERILQSAGAAHIVATHDLAAARGALARSGPFDLVVLDMNLDGESTLPLARELAAAQTPFVFITGYSMKSALPDDLRDTVVLEKPLEERTLVATLARMIRTR